jgi:uridine phosphorylase
MTFVNQPYPILEFDPEAVAILNPQRSPLDPPAPERVVLCFFYEVLAELAARGELTELFRIPCEMGPTLVYRLDTPRGALMVAQPGVGAPLAVTTLEDTISAGGRKIIACGGCGVLRPEIAAGHPVVLTAAVRDEGVSYHYLPAAREIEADPAGVAALEATLRAREMPYRYAKTWTTDAVYRETPARRAARLAEGCEGVEMEAAAFFAVARFRQVTFGQMVYGGDLVVPEGWDHRSWSDRVDDRRLLFELAVEAALAIP